jgi:hypothetical protein
MTEKREATSFVSRYNTGKRKTTYPNSGTSLRCEEWREGLDIKGYCGASYSAVVGFFLAAAFPIPPRDLSVVMIMPVSMSRGAKSAGTELGRERQVLGTKMCYMWSEYRDLK